MTERGIMVDSKELYKLGPVDGAIKMVADLLNDTTKVERKQMTKCIWKEENGVDSDGTYITSCDNMFTIMEGNPKDNNFKYCPYCGKALKEKEANGN